MSAIYVHIGAQRLKVKGVGLILDPAVRIGGITGAQQMEVGTTLEPIRKFKLLIVDDEPTIAQTLAMIFGKSGYEVVSALTSKEALLQLSAEQPDIVLLDVRHRTKQFCNGRQD